MALALLVCAGGLAAGTASADAETRKLKLYYIHTKERAEITYKRNGKYLSSGLKEVNRFLRDWRRNEATNIDPQLLDIVWEAYRQSGSRDYIHVVSAYRSPATNEMLRRTRGGQAKKSQHTLGKAMDFYLPDVPVKKLREIGFKLQGGGVGYYPKSGVPFVHLDTGNVRAWPRMSRSELTRLFPDGRTLHLPPDGNPLPGYQQAMADYQRRKSSGQATTVVRDSGGNSGGRPKTLLGALFGGGADEEEDGAEVSVASRAPAPSRNSAPAPAPSAAPETPATILAALPASRMPRPEVAPRRDLNAGVPVAIQPVAPAAAPAAPAAPEVPTPEPFDPPAETQVAAVEPQEAPVIDFTPPVPGQRPAVLLAASETSDEQRRSAEEIESAIAQATEALSEDDAASEAQRAAILAALRPEAARPSSPFDSVTGLPVPSSANRADPQSPPVVAYAPPSSSVPVEVERPRGARLPVPAERAQRDTAATTEIQTASLPPAPQTAPKTARPAVADPVASSERPAVQASPAPLESVLETAAKGWSMRPDRLETVNGVSERPNFAGNVGLGAPETVYSDGFTRTRPPADTTRFSGNAVTFLSVAKFEGNASGGDGQPLRLQLPVTN